MQLIGGRYQLHHALGAGSMGTVYKAMDTHTQQPVAIKLLKPQSLTSDPGLIERFRREGEALRELNHPNIVKLLDMLEDAGQHYLIMEYVSGGDLSHLLQEGPLPIRHMVNIAIDLADALTRTHRLNIIHRDLKPANTLIADDGTLRLTDFGIAHHSELDGTTEKASLLGTLHYLSPEILNNEPIDNRSDIWSFGVMLYEMLTGTLPFSGESIIDIIESILQDPTPDLETFKLDCPIALIDLIYRMLKKDRDQRIRSVRYIGAELEDIMHNLDAGPQGGPQGGPQHTGDNRRFETFTVHQSEAKHNLPLQITSFIGREYELEALTQLVDSSVQRLITILAPGGMGKTRLALALAEQYIGQPAFINGVYFVELAPLSSADHIITTIANAVKVQLSGKGTAEEQIINYFRAKKILLIMDNYEHLIDGADIVDSILQAAPDVKVIVTSREKLKLRGEAVFTLDGLDFPNLDKPEDALNYNAAKLFLQSARRVLVNYELQQSELNYLARICRLVHGMPLALKLAAAWVEMLSLKEIAQEIENNIDFLETELRNMPERHRSIRAVFDYSWQLLKPEEQTVFVKFAVFRRGFNLAAAQSVTGVELRQLTVFVNKSLLQRNPETGRYQIHELLRQYAEEELKKRSEFQPLRDVHSQYYLQKLCDLFDDVSGLDQLNAINIIEQEIENINAALSQAIDQSNYTQLTQGIASLWRFYLIRGHLLAGEKMFTYIVTRLQNKPTSTEQIAALGEMQAYLFLFKYIFHQYLHDKDEVLDLLQKCTQNLKDNPQPRLQALLSTIEADYHTIFGKTDDARRLCQQAIHYCQQIPDSWLEAYNWRSLGDTYWYRTQYNPDIPNAVRFYEAAYALVRQTGDIYSKDRVLKTLGVLARLDNRFDDAYRLQTESMAMCERLGNLHAMASTLYNLGYMDLIQYHYKEARHYLQRSLDIRHEIGESLLILMPLSWLAHLDMAEGQFASARATFEQGKQIAEAISSPFFGTFFYAGLGMVDVAEGFYTQSEVYFQQALEHAEARDQYHVEGIYRALAIREREQHNYTQALTHFTKALELAIELDDIEGRIETLTQMAWLYYKTGETDQLKATLRGTLDLLQNEKRWPVIMMCRFQSHTLFGNIEADSKRAQQHYARALQTIGAYYPVPEMVIFVTQIAHFMQRIQRYDYATELAAFIKQYDGGYAANRKQAADLLHDLQGKLDAPAFKAAIEHGESFDLVSVVQRLRDTLNV